MGRLNGQAAFITGGESGIGLATARLFVAEGARVHIAGLVRERLEAAGTELGADLVSWSVTDVTEESQVAAAIEQAVSQHGRLDILFSNAGIAGDHAAVGQYSTEVFRRVLDVHVLGAFLVLKHGLPRLSDGGSVIITSSVVGLTAAPGNCAYATAKHAQVGLMRTVAREMAGRGIRVNTIHPGPTDTMFQQAVEVAATGAPPDQAARAFDAMIPLGRHASPDEIARAVLYLASGDSSFMTGSTLAVDGGMHG